LISKIGAVTLVGILLATVFMGYAISQYILRSNIVHVQLEYVLNLTYLVDGMTVTLTATLTYNTSPMVGETINFQRCDDLGNNIELVGNGITDSNGQTSYVYHATLTDLYFIAECTL